MYNEVKGEVACASRRVPDDSCVHVDPEVSKHRRICAWAKWRNTSGRTVYSESMSDINDLRFFRVRCLKLAKGSSSVSDGHGGSTRVGSRSFAPRACILDAPIVMRFWAMELELRVGTGGARSGEGPLIESRPRDFGRRMVDARRSFCGLMKLELPSRGAVCGVSGV